ncbi:fimbrillin family protein [uncultured Bacteroides sp.]|uniref:fimbrillin family protein n=1 Tax=uncultured Bacteroides sp. TaxID=162156 RepID=UPI0025DB6400|nr:fimbrillin family protein [uncultured Bacteroides sp.]
MKNFWNHIIYMAGLLLVATSCSHEEKSSSEVSQGLRITASLRSMHSRAIGGADMTNEQGFKENDVIGLFSSGGNLDENNGPFVNIPMKFDYSSGKACVFVNPDVNADVNSLGKIYLYYPYREGIEKEGGVSIIDQENNRVFDCLHATDDWGEGYRFYHSFCRLKIKCGEGFEQTDKMPDGKQKITVYLDKPADKMCIIDNPANAPNKPFKLLGDKKEFATWEEAGIYTVILPCLQPWQVSGLDFIKVDYITLYDNTGTLQKLYLPHDIFELVDESQNPIHEEWGSLKPGNIFSFTIQMENLKPVVRGGDIQSWEKYDDITIKREHKINEIGQLKDWILQYNNFVKEYPDVSLRPSSKEIEDTKHPLLSYGDYANQRWNFYLGEDLDCSDPAFKESISAYITHLCDTLSGANHTLSNLSLKGNGSTGFIGTISDGGCIQDVRFSSFSIQNSGTTGALCGTIAARMTGGTVTNCRVAGISIRCTSDVFTGTFAGEMTGGAVEHCTFQGAIMGGQSDAVGIYKGIVGKNPSGSTLPKVESVDVTNVIITTSK